MRPTYSRPTSTEKEWRHVANDLEKLWDLPHCIGAIDGKHIGIDCPKNSASNYYNYKGIFSMILLAICDARYNCMMFDVGKYGSINGSNALNKAEFGKAFNQHLFNYPAPVKIPGFPLEKVFPCWGRNFPIEGLVDAPFPRKKRCNWEESHNVFNYLLSRARRFIENTFGILVARWRISRGFVRASPEKCGRLCISFTLSTQLFKADGQ